MAEETDSTKQASSEEILEFMRKSGFNAEPKTESKETIVNLDPDSSETEPVQAPANDNDLPPHAIPTNEDHLKTYVFMGSTDNVEVTKEERDAWLRGFNSDEIIQFDVHTQSGASSNRKFRVKTMTQMETDIINMAVIADKADGSIDKLDMMRQLERYQMYAICIAVTHLDGSPIGNDRLLDPSRSDSENVTALRDFYKKVIRPKPVSLVAQMIRGLCTFEMKCAACLRKVSDPNFWGTPE